jgi:SAM-dependent methyltransferase
MWAGLFARLGGASPGLKRSLWKTWYQILAARYQQADWIFMNYGYADPHPGGDLRLSGADEPNRYAIQLYHQLVSAVDLRSAAILEVGCGRGGGCSFLARYLQAAAVLGVDYSEKAIRFCTRAHQAPNLSFRQGDAEALPCEDAAFDAVVNVESSHCYGSVPAFLGEAFRVLKPGGHFLWADMRSSPLVHSTRRQFLDAGFQSLRERDITAEVLRALDLADERKKRMIESQVPALVRKTFGDFAGVRGSRVYEALRSGEVHYLSCVLRKPAA